MTLARVSPKDGRLPDFWVREKRGKSRRASAGLGLEAAGQGGEGCRADVFGEPLWLQVEKRGRDGKGRGVGKNMAERALLQSLFAPSPGSLI